MRILGLSLLLSACGAPPVELPDDDPLAGTWRRVGDRFAGMELVLRGHAGALSYVPGSAQLAGYAPGEAKWSGVRRLGAGRYRLEDLNVRANAFGDRIEAEYRTVDLQLVEPGVAVVTTRDGRRQVWRRP